MRNPNQEELVRLEQHWNKQVLNYPGIKIASQEPPALNKGAFCEKLIISMWSAIPLLKSKQKTVL